MSEAFFDIQLFGTSEEIRQIKRVVEDRMKNKYTAKEFIRDLRNRLRKEIRLQPTDEEVWGLKIVREKYSADLMPEVNEKGNVGGFQKLVEILKQKKEK